MDVKPGYEQSEVGVIPEDWETDTLLSISCQIMDFPGDGRPRSWEWSGEAETSPHFRRET